MISDLSDFRTSDLIDRPISGSGTSGSPGPGVSRTPTLRIQGPDPPETPVSGGHAVQGYGAGYSLRLNSTYPSSAHLRLGLWYPVGTLGLGVGVVGQGSRYPGDWTRRLNSTSSVLDHIPSVGSPGPWIPCWAPGSQVLGIPGMAMLSIPSDLYILSPPI